MKVRFSSSIILLFVLLIAACAPKTSGIQTKTPIESMPTLRIAVLPIIDTLPMYVAESEKLFEKHGIKVVFIPVASAPERDQLISAGQADGTINETLAVMLFNKEEIQLQVVRYALRPTEGHGHFFILASGQSEISEPKALSRVEIGVSQGTVIEYVTERLLQAEGLTSDEIKTIAVPKISDRMSLLASGELKAGVLPDPLASLAVSQGAVKVLDDSDHPEFGFSVITFRKQVIDKNPDAVRAFLAAIQEATDLINQDASKFNTLLSEKGLVPPPLLGTFDVPPFPNQGLPTSSEWLDAMEWAQGKGILSADVSYEESVNSSVLP